MKGYKKKSQRTAPGYARGFCFDLIKRLKDVIVGGMFGGLAERLLRTPRKRVGVIPCRFKSCTLRSNLTFWNFSDFFAGGAKRRPVRFEGEIRSVRRGGRKGRGGGIPPRPRGKEKFGKIFGKGKDYLCFDLITKVIEKKIKFILIFRINVVLDFLKFSKKRSKGIFWWTHPPIISPTP